MARDSATDAPRIGVIGGSGLYDIPGARVIEEVLPETPWGVPSDRITVAEIAGVAVAFLPRHGRGHRILPGEVNSRANICALKLVGVEQIVSFSAVGSLQEELVPLDFAVPAQVIDRTRQRPGTYFGDGVVGHVGFADPFCDRLGDLSRDVLKEQSYPGFVDSQAPGRETIVCMDGPLFSTRAESELYRSFGAHLINMSVLPEAKLAREAELCYSLICMVTDYDCWRAGDADVDIQMVIANLGKNAERARALLTHLLPRITGGARSCACSHACENAIITAPECRTAESAERLRVLLPRHFNESG